MQKRSVFNGTAKLKVIEAQDLKPTEFSTKFQGCIPALSPYIYLDIDELPIGRTQTVTKNANPSYLHEFFIEVHSGYLLNFNIFHDACVPPDQFVASCSIKFTEIQAKGKNIWLNLDPTGQLHINVSLNGDFIEGNLYKIIKTEIFQEILLLL